MDVNHPGRNVERENDPEQWIDDAVIYGGNEPNMLDPETRFQLVIAAAEAAADDGVLWCIAEQPADHLVGDAPELKRRFHEYRKTSERVNRMFEVMQADVEQGGWTSGWWFEP
jgi:hypothetical protein